MTWHDKGLKFKHWPVALSSRSGEAGDGVGGGVLLVLTWRGADVAGDKLLVAARWPFQRAPTCL